MMKKRNEQIRSVLLIALVLLVAGAATLGAQEGPPPPPDGLTFNGSVTTGLRYRSWAGTDMFSGAPGGYNVFDLYTVDDTAVAGDTASLRASLNRGNYGASFGLGLNANNTQDNFWTAERIYVNDANLWANFLDNKIRVQAGYFFDWNWSPVFSWFLGGGSSNALQLTITPIEGLQFDVRSKTSRSNGYSYAHVTSTSPVLDSNGDLTDVNVNVTSGGNGWKIPDWYDGLEYAANIDGRIRYSNSSVNAWVVIDDNWDDAGDIFGAPRKDGYQLNLWGFFAYTGIPKLTLSVESQFYDVTSQRTYDNFSAPPTDPADVGKDIGITNITALLVGYQITDAFSATAKFAAGGDHTGLVGTTKELLGSDGFTCGVDILVAYKLNDALTFSLQPVFMIEDTEKPEIFDISVRPKLAWTIASFPYGATIGFSYKLKYLSEDGVAYVANNNETLNHTVITSFSWSF
jgi:hypothetical protein